jgi:hypothetical protein
MGARRGTGISNSVAWHQPEGQRGWPLGFNSLIDDFLDSHPSFPIDSVMLSTFNESSDHLQPCRIQLTPIVVNLAESVFSEECLEKFLETVRFSR